MYLTVPVRYVPLKVAVPYVLKALYRTYLPSKFELCSVHCSFSFCQGSRLFTVRFSDCASGSLLLEGNCYFLLGTCFMSKNVQIVLLLFLQ